MPKFRQLEVHEPGSAQLHGLLPAKVSSGSCWREMSFALWKWDGRSSVSVLITRMLCCATKLPLWKLFSIDCQLKQWIFIVALFFPPVFPHIFSLPSAKSASHTLFSPGNEEQFSQMLLPEHTGKGTRCHPVFQDMVDLSCTWLQSLHHSWLVFINTHSSQSQHFNYICKSGFIPQPLPAKVRCDECRQYVIVVNGEEMSWDTSVHLFIIC